MFLRNQLPTLKDNIHIILHGSHAEKEKIKGQFFYLADTPEFMKELGLTGEYFNIRYGVIIRHKGKDKDHDLSENNWIDLCDAISKPFAIAVYGNGFRLFTSVKMNDRFIIAGVDVKNVAMELEVNAISTAFGYDHGQINGIIYRAKNLTPEQAALLDGHSSLSLPPARDHDAEHEAQPTII